MPLIRNAAYNIAERIANVLPLADATVVYQHAALGLSSGRVRPLQSGDTFAGFAGRRVDSRALATGAPPEQVPIIRSGEVLLPVSATVGASVYATADDTFSTAGGSYIGKVVRLEGSGAWVAFEAQSGSAVSGDGKSTSRSRRFGAKLRAGASASLALMGDSTGNETTEWFYKLGLALAAAYPAYRVDHILWNTGTVGYDAATVLASPALPSVVAFEDTFTSDSAATFGRRPDRTDGVVGNSWSRDGAGADGDWSVSGGVLVRSSDTVVSAIICGNGVAGDQTWALSGVTLSTVGDGAATQILRLMHQYVDANNHLFSELRVSSAGAVSVVLQKRIAGVNTNMVNQTSGITQILNNTAGQTVDLEVRKVGLSITYYINGVQQATTNILAADDTALAGATQAGIVGGNGNLIGMTINSVRLTVSPAPAVLRLYNGSAPGQTLAYQTTNQAAMMPVPFDAIVISHGHNYGLGTPDAFADTVLAYVDQLPAAQARADVFLRSQNPQKSPALYVTQHAQRQRRLRPLAESYGFGYLPCLEAYEALGTAGAEALLNADGVHPLAGGSDIECAAALGEFLALAA